MAILTAANVSLSLGTRLLLDQVNFSLAAGRRIGLVGRNGCGKSTLMKMMAGVEGVAPDQGQIQISRGTTVGYLPQDARVTGNRTLWEEALAAMGDQAKLQEHAQAIASQMAEARDDDELERLLRRYEQLEHQIQAGGGYAVEHRVEQTLQGVGLGSELFDIPAQKLSGGQRGRLALAGILLQGPDVLLLDEPTNHLDIEGRQWLERYLLECNEAVVMVSHDRWLLDRVVHGIAELDQGRLLLYPGNYQQYREQRALNRLTQHRAYEKQQEAFKKERAYIDRYKAGQRARQAKGRERRLERQIRDEALDRPIELGQINLGLRPIARCGDKVIESKGLTMAYPGKKLFAELDLELGRGDCLGIVGPNGAGKTTLVNCLLGMQTPTAGITRTGSGVDIGYFRQLHDHLDLSQSIISYLQAFVANNTEQEARDLAGAFLFSGLEQEKSLGVVSGGERSRAVLAGLLASGHNLLVLDEPTNHLDLSAAERLEEFLLGFISPQRNSDGIGTLILITHDRALLSNIAKRLLILDGNGRARLFDGNYREYLQSLDASSAALTSPSDTTNRKASSRPTAVEKKVDAKAASAGREVQPRPKSGGAITKLSDAALEKELAAVESRISEIDQSMMDPQLLRDGSKSQALLEERETCRLRLEQLEEEWLRRVE